MTNRKHDQFDRDRDSNRTGILSTEDILSGEADEASCETSYASDALIIRRGTTMAEVQEFRDDLDTDVQGILDEHDLG